MGNMFGFWNVSVLRPVKRGDGTMTTRQQQQVGNTITIRHNINARSNPIAVIRVIMSSRNDFAAKMQRIQTCAAYCTSHASPNTIRCQAVPTAERVFRFKCPFNIYSIFVAREYICLKVRIYKTVILPVVLYGCETWSLAVREEHKLRVFQNRVLRRIFGPKWDEVTGGWRKLHNEELHNLYSSPSIIRNIKSRRMRCAGHVERMGESKNVYRLLVGKPGGK
jgi:hypothetical protein